jgi:dihydrofolate synthase/folylpolyglutamate synthase
MRLENLGLRDGKQRARLDGRDFALGLIGPHQVENAACAARAMAQLGAAVVPDDALSRGLAATVWPGRFEIVSESPLIVLDGAHNPAGMRKLVETWRAFLAGRGWAQADGRAHLVFASVADKDVTEIARLLRPLARHVSLLRLANERSADPAALASHFAGLPCRTFDSVGALWNEIERAPHDVPILCAGSLFLAGEVLARQEPGGTAEYRLNERLENLTGVR